MEENVKINNDSVLNLGSCGLVVMFSRSWVKILALDTGWTFFHINCCKNCNIFLKDRKICEKEAGVICHFLKMTPLKKALSLCKAHSHDCRHSASVYSK